LIVSPSSSLLHIAHILLFWLLPCCAFRACDCIAICRYCATRWSSLSAVAETHIKSSDHLIALRAKLIRRGYGWKEAREPKLAKRARPAGGIEGANARARANRAGAAAPQIQPLPPPSAAAAARAAPERWSSSSGPPARCPSCSSPAPSCSSSAARWWRWWRRRRS
jgi:hypothetical protein